MNTIINISVESIINSEINPRMQYGDLTELRDSIARQGILQPISVVPRDDGNYQVIMGHRRLEAAKQAGLTEVPCIVQAWSEDEQLGVMMTENMLREQLTTYEEAKGFQMMLDLGKSVEQISEETGFSQSTVRNRTKLLSLDESLFRDGVERGATLADFTKLYEIEDEQTRNAVLRSAGTKDFQSKLNAAVANERMQRQMAELERKIAEWATKITTIGYVDGVRVNMGYVKCFFVDVANPQKPSADKQYYYYVNSSNITVYALDEENDDIAAEMDRRRQVDRSLKEIAESCFRLRMEFVQNFSNFRQYGRQIMQMYMKCSVKYMATLWKLAYSPSDFDRLLNVSDAIHKLDELRMEKVALASIMIYMDSVNACTWDVRHSSGRYEYYYKKNNQLSEWYAFLTTIGYEISTEEQNMLDGNVENVIKEAA